MNPSELTNGNINLSFAFCGLALWVLLNSVMIIEPKRIVVAEIWRYCAMSRRMAHEINYSTK